VNYIGAGTVEFIYDIPNDDVYFMEMNTRLQVEHPVTEVVTGVDIVEKQFQIASGESIADMKFSEEGYGLEVRVNAEKAIVDSEGNISFAPTPGEIKTCVLPEADHIELISIAGEGKLISPFYDSLIIQIISYGKDRKDAVNKMSEYLDSVVIKGICTNIPIIKKILKDDVFLKGKYDTGYLPAFLSRIDSGKLINEIEEASGNLGKSFSFDMLKIDESDELKVLSPSTGVFYRAPSPSEPEYVNVGDMVSTKDVLCELEAMKMFSTVCLNTFAGDDRDLYNPDSMYKITRINITDGQQVNEGDLLFVIRPVASES
jgi:acetyl/propionyl-CoA carboxylase alpha subunit